MLNIYRLENDSLCSFATINLFQLWRFGIFLQLSWKYSTKFQQLSSTATSSHYVRHNWHLQLRVVSYVREWAPTIKASIIILVVEVVVIQDLLRATQLLEAAQWVQLVVLTPQADDDDAPLEKVWNNASFYLGSWFVAPFIACFTSIKKKASHKRAPKFVKMFKCSPVCRLK